MFETNHSRFATFGVISNLPGEIIDSIWMIIDRNLQGVGPLNNLLRFDLQNNQGKLTVHFSKNGAATEMSVDLPFPYDPSFPDTVMAYDDGESQTILLPEEGHKK